VSQTTFDILPVRHHGPGSARSVLRVLQQLKPDIVLLEGPPDAEEVIALAGRAEMVPPVALLVHPADTPSDAVYYPFAAFSPEWNALRWALNNNVPVRFIDLPQYHAMALDRLAVDSPHSLSPTPPDAAAHENHEEPPEQHAATDESPQSDPHEPLTRSDPLQLLAQAAGFEDGERWWNHVVEHRRSVELDPDADQNIFIAIREAMAAVRQHDNCESAENALREAFMRRSLREVSKLCLPRAAVICGAYHAPALVDLQSTKKNDDALLKGLPKIKTVATWVPWTHDMLTRASGYGAGVESPGWYGHLFEQDTLVIERWMTRIAQLLREHDLDCSPAHVIESVRLAHALAAMRTRPIADLSDIAESARSVFCHESDAPMRIIARQLHIGDQIGEVPQDTPQVPLKVDLLALQRSLKLKPAALEKVLDLDLRKEIDLGRSLLLHRLNILGIDWGRLQDGSARAKGTFKESWLLRWDPTFEVRIIESARLGNTIPDAASGFVAKSLQTASDDLPALASMLDRLLLADLPTALDALLRRIDVVAAVASDVQTLMDALPPLARAARYGSVRQTEASILTRTISGVLPRIIAGLPPACGSLNDEAADQIAQRISRVHDAIALLGSETCDPAPWIDVLKRLSHQPHTHGQVCGKCARLLFDASHLSSEQAATDMSIALSTGNDPAHAAAWLQGFIEGSGLVLIHDPILLDILDTWVTQIPQSSFVAVLPLIRRTFASFAPPERRHIGQKIAQHHPTRPQTGRPATSQTEVDLIDSSRAVRVLPTLAQVLGFTLEPRHE
jgi:hypothetical protein